MKIKENNRFIQLNKTIFDVNSSKYFHEKNDYESFNKLKGESQLMIILGISDQNQNNKNIQNISSLLKLFSNEQLKSNYKYNQINYITIKTNDNQKKLFEDEKYQELIIPFSVFEMLKSNQSIKSQEMINIINNFEEIHTKIHLSSSKNYEILNDFIKIKKSTEFKLIIDIILSKIDENDETFQNNMYIKTVKIEPNVNEIKCVKNKGFFEGCSSLTKVIIPSSVTKICAKSFKNCSNLKEITIPSSATIIEESSFENCSSLEKISIQSALTSISNNLFKGCSSLKEFIIPPSVKTIGVNSFNGCSSLIEIVIPSLVMKLNDNCFYGCSNLKKISMNFYKTAFLENSFDKCPLLNNFLNSISILINKQNQFISSQQTDEIFENGIFHSSNILAQIEQFSNKTFEVKYPSSSFDNIFRILIKMKQNSQTNIKISIFISGTETTDQYFYNNNYIDCIKFDSNIKKYQVNLIKDHLKNVHL